MSHARSKGRCDVFAAALSAAVLFATTSAGADEGAAATDEAALSPEALVHLQRFANDYMRSRYAGAQNELRHVARLAPDWHPVHLNKAILAEARGKLHDAIESYQAYLPHATESERRSLAPRVEMLEKRRQAAISTYRSREIGAWSVISLGIASTVFGAIWLPYWLARDNQALGQGVGQPVLTVGVFMLIGGPMMLPSRNDKTKLYGQVDSATRTRKGFDHPLVFRF